MTTNNSPAKVLSRLVHSDYFDNISPMYMELWTPKIEEHKLKCQHPKCKSQLTKEPS